VGLGRHLDADLVAGLEAAGLHDAEVGAGALRRGEEVGEVVVAHADAELVAGLAGLADLEHDVADRPSVADPGTREVDALGREVLAEGAERLVGGGVSVAQRRGPPLVVLDGVGVDRLVRTAVHPPVGLVVTRQVDALDPDRSLDRALPDAGGDLAAAPRHGARLADVDRHDPGRPAHGSARYGDPTRSPPARRREPDPGCPPAGHAERLSTTDSARE
jgi:hypothetical protein